MSTKNIINKIENNNNINNSSNDSKKKIENKKTIDDEIDNNINTEMNENNTIINNENYKLNQIHSIINNNLNNNNNNDLNKNISNSSFSKKSQNSNTKINTSNLKSIESKNQNFYQNIEDKDLYVLKTFQTVKILLISLFISMIYSLLFSILLLYYNENSFPPNCKNLKRMNRATYIILFISIVFSIICTIIHIKYRLDYEYSKKILQIRSIYNYVITLVFLISLTIVYIKTKNKKECGNVWKVDLAYIICEWIILILCYSGFWAIVIIIFCCKSKHIQLRENDEIPIEEMKKLI